MKKVALNIIILLSCTESEFNYGRIVDHTFYQLTKKETSMILYKPCDANYISYKIKKNYIVHNFGQEDDTIKQIKIRQISPKEILVEGFNTNTKSAEKITLKKLDNQKKFIIEIDKKKYVDSIHSNNIKTLKQSCKECYNACK
ncbi:hypothetical protein ACMGDK_07355 [Chryseobacterium sp. DT-3]|uniref:hypothetical protein n=1 Tax=Chryseobacterium sp. DT-3 TaxID=3396164 RepID=UPI003F1A905A